MMKIFTFSLFTLLTLLNSYPRTVLEGYVYNASSSTGTPKQIGVKFFDLSTGQEHVYMAPIQVDGTFKLHFPGELPQDVSLVYGKRTHPIFIQPDSLLVIGVNATSYLDRTHSSALDFMGTHSRLNYTIQRYMSAYEKLPHHLEHKANKRMLGPNEYKQYRNKVYHLERSFLSQFLIDHHASKLFKTWAENGILYHYGMDLIRYSWLHPVLNEDISMTLVKKGVNEVEHSYFNFFDLFPLNRDSSFIHSNYGRYIKEFKQHLLWKQQKEASSISFSDQVKLIAQSAQYISILERERLFVIANTKPESVVREDRQFVEQIIQSDSVVRAHLARQACMEELTSVLDINEEPLRSRLISWFMNDLIEDMDWDAVNGMMPVFLEEVSSDRMRIQVQNNYQMLRKHLYRPNFSANVSLKKVNSIEKDSILNEIFSQEKGSILYLVFWSPWSTPCKDQIQDLKLLEKLVPKERIKIINICMDEDEKFWKATISKYRWEGKHYFLSNTQSKSLIQHFEMKAVPHYVIVNSQGKVIRKDAPSPKDSTVLSQYLLKFSNVQHLE